MYAFIIALVRWLYKSKNVFCNSDFVLYLFMLIIKKGAVIRTLLSFKPVCSCCNDFDCLDVWLFSAFFNPDH